MNGFKTALITVSAFLAAGGAVYLAKLLKEDQGEDLTKQLSITQRLNAPIAWDAKVRDESGKEVTFKSLFRDKPVVLMPIFYNCRSACSIELESALKAFRDMKADTIGQTYDVATISIHPKETAQLASAKKNEYLERYLAGREGDEASARAGWHFLTGKEKEVQKLVNSAGFGYTYTPAKDRLVHPTGLILITPQGRVSRYLIGTEYASKFLRDSLVDASQGVIGEPTVVTSYFGCFTYDPSTGKTMFHVQRAIQIVGSIFLLTMILSIISMNKKFKEEHGIGIKEASGDSTSPQ